MTTADIQALVRDLTAIVRLQNGNLHDDINAILARADAALAALSRTPGEAVAWRHEHPRFGVVSYETTRLTDADKAAGYTETPLYAHPAPAAPAEPPTTPSIAKGAQWCQPGDRQNERHFIVRFDDADRGDAVFTDEAEAREFWARATMNWNCWLFGAMPVQAIPAAPAGEIEAVKAAIRRACADEVNGRPNGDIIVKGCEAAEYVNPEDAAASFVDSIAEEVCAALSASPPGAIAPGVEEIQAAMVKAQTEYRAERDAALAKQGYWPDRSSAPMDVLAAAVFALIQPAAIRSGEKA